MSYDEFCYAHCCPAVACHGLACMCCLHVDQRSCLLLSRLSLGVIPPPACRRPLTRAPQRGNMRGRPGRSRMSKRPSAPSRPPPPRRRRARSRVRGRKSPTSAPSAWQRRWHCSTDWHSLPPGSPTPGGTRTSAGPTPATRLSLSPWAIWSRWVELDDLSPIGKIKFLILFNCFINLLIR